VAPFSGLYRQGRTSVSDLLCMCGVVKCELQVPLTPVVLELRSIITTILLIFFGQDIYYFSRLPFSSI
jgi:hypothetical protein